MLNVVAPFSDTEQNFFTLELSVIMASVNRLSVVKLNGIVMKVATQEKKHLKS
jgi:hypothetical protein